MNQFEVIAKVMLSKEEGTPQLVYGVDFYNGYSNNKFIFQEGSAELLYRVE